MADSAPTMVGERVARILVVDDQPGMRQGCQDALRAKGYEVACAADGLAGLELLRRQQFDLVLVDLKMPRMDGLQFLKEMQSLDPTIVCVVITGYATLEMAVEATKRGAYDFLSKPFTPRELHSAVRRALERRSLMLEARRLREERERNLLAISTEQSRLRTVINCLVDGILVTNREGDVVLCNPAARRLLGLTAGNLVGTPIARLSASPDLIGALDTTLAGEAGLETMLSIEIEQATPQPLTLMANVAPVIDEAGAMLGAVAVLRDVTRLKELDRAKSRFVRMVAHELRAPVGAIMQYVDVLAAGKVRSDEERGQHALRRCRERGSALLGLIDDLLNISAIQSGRVARRLVPLDLAPLLQETVDLFRAQAETAEVTLELRAAGGLPPIYADRDDIARLFANLVSNAIKYNRHGGSVRVDVLLFGSSVRVDVADTGVGIPETALPHLFEEFFRANLPETRQVTGTGLGLSIVKAIAEAHHGYVVVQSEYGKGTTFTVYLPAYLPRPIEPGDGGEQARPAPGPGGDGPVPPTQAVG